MSGLALSILLAVICISASIALISILLFRYIYRRAHHLPVGDCACCHTSKKKILKAYHKKYSSK